MLPIIVNDLNSLQTNNSINFRVKKKKRLLVEYRFENEDDEMAQNLKLLGD